MRTREIGFITRALAGRKPMFAAGLFLLSLGLLAPMLCDANTTYQVSGTFGTTVFSGPLNGGTFSGTFDATLPASGLFESITSFNIELISASGVVLADMTNATPGFSGFIEPQGTTCSVGVTCGIIAFGNGSTFLQLVTSSNFAGGSVFPWSPSIGSFAGLGGNTGPTDSAVTSGSIVLTPEPSSLLLLGTGLLGLMGMGLYKKRLA